SQGACVAMSCSVEGAACVARPAQQCNGQKLLQYMPVGKCMGGVCQHQSTSYTCSAGCFSGNCLLQSNVEETLPAHPSSVRLGVACDRGGTPHFAYCYLGVVSYRRKGVTGWQTQPIATDVGSACEVGITVDDRGLARIVYNVSNTIPNRVELATETSEGV